MISTAQSNSYRYINAYMNPFQFTAVPFPNMHAYPTLRNRRGLVFSLLGLHDEGIMQNEGIMQFSKGNVTLGCHHLTSYQTIKTGYNIIQYN